MEGTPRTFGMPVQVVANLLGIGSDIALQNDQPSDFEFTVGLLHDHLRSKIALVVSRDSSDNQDWIQTAIHQLSGETLGDLLARQDTEVELLQEIRDCARQFVGSSVSKLERHVAITIYYAAIANALVYQQTRITRMSWEELEQSFQRLSKKPWLTTHLQELLTKGAEYSRMKRDRSR